MLIEQAVCAVAFNIVRCHHPKKHKNLPDIVQIATQYQGLDTAAWYQTAEM